MYVQINVVVRITQTHVVIIIDTICEVSGQQKYRFHHVCLIRYISNVKKHRVNVQEEENNDHSREGCSLLLNKLTIKEVFNTFNTTTV